MKKINLKSILVVVLLTVFQFSELMAKNHPPAPKGSGGFGDDVVVGGPIDSYLPLLFFMAMVFGVLILNKKQKNKRELVIS